MIFLQLINDIFNRAVILAHQSSAQSVTQHFDRKMADKLVLAFEENLFESLRPLKGEAIGHLPAGVDGLPSIFGSPPADGLEIFQTEAQRIDPVMAGGTGRILAVDAQTFTQGFGRLTLSVLREFGDIGRRGWRWSAQDGFHYPFAPQNRAGTVRK